MKTRYPTARIVATLLGLWAADILKELVAHFPEGPPTPGHFLNPSIGGFSWLDDHPYLSFQFALLWTSAAFGGTLLTWYRPRAGYFCAGMGYLLYLTLCQFQYYSSPWARKDLGTSCFLVAGFVLPVWLFRLCVKDEPEGQKKTGSNPDRPSSSRVGVSRGIS